MAEETKEVSSTNSKYTNRLHNIIENINNQWMVPKKDESTLDNLFFLMDRLYMELEAYFSEDEREKADKLMVEIQKIDKLYGNYVYFSRKVAFCRDTNKLKRKIFLLKNLEKLLRRVMRKNNFMVQEIKKLG
jgi:hypothetical protein